MNDKTSTLADASASVVADADVNHFQVNSFNKNTRFSIALVVCNVCTVKLYLMLLGTLQLDDVEHYHVDFV